MPSISTKKKQKKTSCRKKSGGGHKLKWVDIVARFRRNIETGIQKKSTYLVQNVIKGTVQRDRSGRN